MSPLDSPSSSSSPAPSGRKRRSFARRCERRCCTVASYFPLAFIYSLTSWAAYVEAGLGLSSLYGETRSWTARPTSILGVCLYILLNLSYTIAVFTDPGSPSSPRNSSRKDYKGYSHLPTIEPSAQHTSTQPVTVSSTGAPRYCKKCSHPKPDRTHHCSTCRRCVLKMDHHCPWLATCVGLHNYKAFVLFLVYTSLFCWVCFGSTAYWVWTQVLSEQRYMENLMPINVILLAVISGIIGLVLTGFTSWHLYLCAKGMTTIECLEKTRYLRGVRTRVERQRIEALHHPYNPSEPHGVQERLQRAGEAVLEFHANAIPGATRLEEGEERPSPTTTPTNPIMPPHPHPSYRPSAAASAPAPTMLTPAQSSLTLTYASHEASRERARYEDYLADQASSKLPHAFDLGWRRNLSHLFGPKWYLWPLPATNTTGDGWRWELSPKWLHAVEEQAEQRRNHHHNHDSDAPAPQALFSGGGSGSSSGLRGGGGGAAAAAPLLPPDLDNASYHHHYDPRPSSREGAMSLQTLKRPARYAAPGRQQRDKKKKKGRRRLRRDLDYGEAGEEVGFFEVSNSSGSEREGEEGEGRSEGARGKRGERHNEDCGWRDWE